MIPFDLFSMHILECVVSFDAGVKIMVFNNLSKNSSEGKAEMRRYPVLGDNMLFSHQLVTYPSIKCFDIRS